MWKKENTCTLLVGIINPFVQPLLKTLRRFLKKLKIELPYNPTISLLGIYLKEIKTESQRYTHPSMFIASLFTIDKILYEDYMFVNRWMDIHQLLLNKAKTLKILGKKFLLPTSIPTHKCKIFFANIMKDLL